MEARAIRAITAEEAAPRAMAGRMRCMRVPFPPAGNQRSCTEKTSIKSRPSQKMGMDIPKRAPTMLRLSKKEYCFVEEMTPATRPRKPAIKQRGSWLSGKAKAR